MANKNPSRLCDILHYQLENYPRSDAVNCKVQGVWKNYSTEECVRTSENISAGLHESGIGKGDKIAIISENRSEWNFIDIGAMNLGAVTVPLYPTQALEQITYILNDAEAKLLFVSTEALYNRIQSALKNVKSLQKIFSFDEVTGVENWKQISKLGTIKLTSSPNLISELKSKVDAEDLATLIYTSGTTGEPKGVMLSHRNIVSNILAGTEVLPLFNSYRALSFLPLCHSFEHTVFFVYVYKGVGVYYAEAMDKIAENLREVHPHLFTTVPRLLEKVYEKIMAKGSALTGIKRKLFFWAVALGQKYNPEKSSGLWYDIQLWLANKIIFSKWREALGGQVVYLVSGAAALNMALAKIFSAAQIKIYQGYGLTETSPIMTSNGPSANKMGTVGRPLPGVEVKIADDGEILCKGENVMMGYYKKTQATAETIRDSWLYTGDVGELDADGFLKITDRKKELFKTSGGKYIAPQPIENELKLSPFIEQAMVVGENRKFPAVLIVPAFLTLEEELRKTGKNFPTHEELASGKEANDLIHREIDKVNARLGQTEQIKKFVLLSKEWMVDTGELTPTLKLRRKIIAEKNKNVIEEIYKE